MLARRSGDIIPEKSPNFRRQRRALDLDLRPQPPHLPRGSTSPASEVLRRLGFRTRPRRRGSRAGERPEGSGSRRRPAREGRRQSQPWPAGLDRARPPSAPGNRLRRAARLLRAPIRRVAAVLGAVMIAARGRPRPTISAARRSRGPRHRLNSWPTKLLGPRARSGRSRPAPRAPRGAAGRRRYRQTQVRPESLVSSRISRA